jgi:MFS family permease
MPSAFIRLLGYRALIVLSYQALAVAVGWHIYELTGDALALGMIGLAEIVPYLAAALFAGHVVDHHSRRGLGAAASLAVSLGAAGLALQPFAAAAVPPQIAIYAVMGLNGFSRAFIGPSYQALFGRLLPRDAYPRGAAVGTSVFQLALVVGPVFGGLLLAWAGTTWTYAAAALLAALSALAMWSIAVPGEAPAVPAASIWHSIREGVDFVVSRPVVLGAMTLDMFAVLFGGMVALLPAFIHDVLHLGPESLGLLRAAPGAGAVITGLLLARHPPDRHAGRILLVAVAGFGLCSILFALSDIFWLSAALLLLSGVCDGFSVVIRNTLIQLATPDLMRGRVAAISGIFIGSSNELGAFESGVAARLL